ncbi:MAG: hypothetical protein ACYCYE_09055 [Clostridia bacterium]
MCCERSKSCCTGECAGHCESSLNTIVELEIHYSESKEAEMAAYIFESLYCLTNIQRKELKLTGLEENRYESLDIMKLQVIDYLTQTDSSSCELYKNVDVVYIRDDI